MAASGGPVHAAAWSMSEQASVGAGYDDNILLWTDQPRRAANASANLGLHLERHSDALALTLDPRIVAVRYDNYSEFNRTEQYLNATAQHQSELGNMSLALNWTRDTTLTSEAGLTGNTTVNKPHEAFAATFSNVRQWSERWDTSTQLYATTNRYSDAGLTNLVDYNYGAAQFGIDYSLTAASQLSLSGSMSKLQVPDFSYLDKSSDSATLSYSASLAQRWQVKLAFGPSRVRSQFGTEQGTLYQASVTRQSEISNIQLSIGRDITPTGQGVLTRREQVNLVFSRELAERLNLQLRANWIKNNNILLGYGFIYNQVRYSEVNASLNWRLTPTWTASLSGGHTEQSSQYVTGSATRNQVSLGVTWTGLAHSPRHLLH